jgi:putative transposase
MGLMTEYRHGPHSVFEIPLHLVWVTTYRTPVRSGAVGVRVRDLIPEIAGFTDVLLIKGHVSTDHVALRVSLVPQVTIRRLVRRLKGRRRTSGSGNSRPSARSSGGVTSGRVGPSAAVVGT